MKKIITLMLMVSLVFVLVSCDTSEVDGTLDKVDDILSKNVDKLVEAENNKANESEEPVVDPTEEPVAATEEPVAATEEPVVATEEPVAATEAPTAVPTVAPTVKPVVKTKEVELMLINNNGSLNNLYIGDSKGSSKDMQPGETKIVKVTLKVNENKIDDSLVVNCEKSGKVVATENAKVVGQFVEGKPVLAIWDGSKFVVNY